MTHGEVIRKILRHLKLASTRLRSLRRVSPGRLCLVLRLTAPGGSLNRPRQPSSGPGPVVAPDTAREWGGKAVLRLRAPPAHPAVPMVDPLAFAACSTPTRVCTRLSLCTLSQRVYPSHRGPSLRLNRCKRFCIRRVCCAGSISPPGSSAAYPPLRVHQSPPGAGARPPTVLPESCGAGESWAAGAAAWKSRCRVGRRLPTPAPRQIRTRRFPPSGFSVDVTRGDSRPTTFRSLGDMSSNVKTLGMVSFRSSHQHGPPLLGRVRALSRSPTSSLLCSPPTPCPLQPPLWFPCVWPTSLRALVLCL